MFCEKCGTQLPDGVNFCEKCGAKVEAETAQPTETPAPEAFASEAPAQETPISEALENFAQSEVFAPQKKKSKKFLAWLIPAVAVLVAAAIAAAVFFDVGSTKGLFLKSFGSDVAYRDYVQENTTKSATNTVSDAYGAVVDALSSENKAAGAADISLKFNMGDKAIAMLEDLAESELDEEISLDWAKEIELKLSANAKDDLQQIGAALNISSKEIATVDAILNMDQGKLFVAILSLSDEYLAIDFSEYLAMPQIATATEYLQDSELFAALPTEEELNSLLTKYVNIAISSFDDVEKSSETMKVGELEQKLTVLETTIDGDALLDAAEAVLNELAKDKDVKKIITEMVEYLADQEDFSEFVDVDEVLKAYDKGLEEALDSLKEVDGDDMEGELVLTQYVNNAHEVVGYALEVEDQQVVHFVEIKDGNKIAFELEIPNALEIVGEGTEKKGVVNAEYVVSVETPTWDDDYNVSYEKMEVLTLSLIDFQAEGELVNGKIRLAPSAALLDEMDLPASASSAINLAQLQLELDIDQTKTSSAVAFNILSGEDLMVGISIAATEKAASDVTQPETAYDIENIEAWAKTMDITKILKALKDAGLPMDEIGELVFDSAMT